MSETPVSETAAGGPEGAVPAMDWYIVHTYSGFEDRVVQELTNRIKALGMEIHFGEIRVPKETVVEMRGGKRKNLERKFFPGYVLVQMEMSDETWHRVRNTPKVTGFVGGSSNSPAPLTHDEVNAGLGTRKACDGVRLAAGVSGLGLVLFASRKESPAGARDV